MLTHVASAFCAMMLAQAPAQQAGGRYGGPDARGESPTRKALTDGMEWLTRQQQPDGGFVDATGKPDLEGAALVVLIWLGDGSTLQAGPHQPMLQRCVDWLLARQQEDGSFEPLAPGSVPRHALVTYALAEASGLTPHSEDLRDAVTRALSALFARREKDGGWSRIPGGPSEPLATAWSLLAIASAAFFEIPVHAKPAALVTWFDAHPSNEPPPAAAELFCRFLAGQTPKTTPPMTTLADALLAAKDVATPDTTYWTTNAMFQFGGSHWTAWSERGMTALLQTQVRDGEHKGTWAPSEGTSRLATTALHALSLQAYYRYTRVYR